mgnify:CR=1 FL=1
MFRLKLILKRIDAATIALVFPLWYRLVFLGIGAILLASMIAVGEFAAAPFIFILLAVLSAGYTEAWYFSKENGITHSFGIYPLLKTNRVALTQVDRLELERFTRGRMTAPEKAEDERKKRLFETDYTTLRLVGLSGETTNIDTVKSNQHDELIRAAEQIAALLDKPLLRKD